MAQADEIRDYALAHYIVPARTAKLQTVTIRTGDVHDGMHLEKAMPAVCGALGTKKFEQLAHVRRTDWQGSAQSSAALLTFKLL